MVNDAERYMQMALNLAKKGIGSVEPNPVVGAVITKANQIIGKGWHKKFGGPHAEINAIEDCKTLGVSPSGATMYVSLEPCCHYGKTGPCTQAIIEAALAKVIIATADPSGHAGARSIDELKNAGIEVQTGVCEKQAMLLNAPFLKYALTGKCWVILKWAQTIDGKLADKEHKWISNDTCRADVQKLRRRVQAVLVGINTVIQDDPLLTARTGKGKTVTRIVMDNNLRIPPDSKLIATAIENPLIIFTRQASVNANQWIVQHILRAGGELLPYPDTNGRSNLFFLLDELSKRGISQLLVEGGPTILSSFLRESLADEIRVYVSPKILGSQGSAPVAGPLDTLTQQIGLHYVEVKPFDDNVMLAGLTEKALAELSIPEEPVTRNPRAEPRASRH
jgi:diaminohydroxyphosphoribosylaminopyrimidine deaminase/5-amino-6-(5-phosphoribosylamino)uracil reductase